MFTAQSAKLQIEYDRIVHQHCNLYIWHLWLQREVMGEVMGSILLYGRLCGSKDFLRKTTIKHTKTTSET